MNNLKPYIIFAIIGFTILIGLLIYGIRDSRVSEPPPESQTELKLGTLFLEGGSAVKGVVIPAFWKPETLGTLVEKIERLNGCENYGNWDKNRIVDTNGEYSYGGLMFQMPTFLHFGKLYRILPKDFTEKDALKDDLIYDRDIQTALALKMIEHKISHIHWEWCWQWIGY